MRLVRLRLLNFRQHADTAIEFGPGLTGIIGPNGAGKTTILEAIAWAIYGAAAARGTNDTIRFARAPARSRVEVELVFGLGGHEYRVLRTLTGADVWLDGGANPVATSVAGVSDYLQRRLGMSREEFFNTYFTGQKELQFLARMGPAQRARFLGQVLGYERLRVAQDKARTRRNDLRHEADGVRGALPDPRALGDARVAAARRRREAGEALDTAEAELTAAGATLADVEPRWQAAEAAREDARAAAREFDLAAAELERAQRENARTAAELQAVVSAAAELAPLQEQLRALPTLEQECEHLDRRAREAERRRALEDAERHAGRELERLAERLTGLEQAPALLGQYTAEAERLRVELATAEAAAQRVHAEWAGQKGEAESTLRSYRDRAQELREQLQQLRRAGPDGVCPTCERPLGKEFERVVGRLQEEWDRVVQDGKWLKRRVDQLQERPEEVAAAETARFELQRSVEERAQRIARCERAAQELTQARTERADRQRRLEELRAELAGLSAGYDPEGHQQAERRLAELRALERRAAALEQAVSARATREAEQASARSAHAAARLRLDEAEGRRARLDFSNAQLEAVRAEHETARARMRAAELRATERRGAAAAAAEALETALRAEAAYQEKRAALQALELELRHLTELDNAFTQLRAELNARVRPELSELASTFLAEITDGRYTSLDIDERYDILVLDEGEEKPVISGGEEDVANLVLRLAISQMIAERAGHPLSILILDEIFGSLDVDRRDAVIQLLQKLENRFEQVILITHIETVHEGLDHVLRVSFDERTGASVVTEEQAPVAITAEFERTFPSG